MLDKKFLEEIEKKITEIMDTFSSEGPISEVDRTNFEMLKSINTDLSKKMNTEDYDQNDMSEFLRNFVEEFDNTYAEGLPEAIIGALKKGKRTDLTNEWWSKKKS